MKKFAFTYARTILCQFGNNLGANNLWNDNLNTIIINVYNTMLLIITATKHYELKINVL
jgi:hypothetical protein